MGVRRACVGLVEMLTCGTSVGVGAVWRTEWLIFVGEYHKEQGKRRRGIPAGGDGGNGSGCVWDRGGVGTQPLYDHDEFQ